MEHRASLGLMIRAAKRGRTNRMRTVVRVTKRFDIDPQVVWNTISAGDGLDKWLPVISQCRLEGSGEGAVRYCTLSSGAQLRERIVEVNHASRRFRYWIDDHPLPARNLFGTVEVRDLGSNKAKVSWSADFDADEPHRAELEGMFREVYSGRSMDLPVSSADPRNDAALRSRRMQRRTFMQGISAAIVAAAGNGTPVSAQETRNATQGAEASAHAGRIIVFDVIETLLDLNALKPDFEVAFGDPASLREFFSQMLQSAFAITVAGIYVDFGQVAKAALTMTADRRG